MAEGVTGKGGQAMAAETPDPMGLAAWTAGTGQLFQTLPEEGVPTE